MTSKTFVLSDVTRKDMCVKFMIVVIMLSILAIAVFVGIYAFRTSQDAETSGCKSPELDPNGLSNWTIGAELIVFGCFPGHQIEGSDDVITSHCINDQWSPPPPACAALPLKIDCEVDQNGLKGSISMWQISNTTPTFIHGFLNTSSVDKSKIVLSESIFLSRQNCTIDTDFNATCLNGKTEFDDIDPIFDCEDGDLEIYFNSTQLLAYKKAEVRVTMVFIDIPTNLTATLISVTQGSTILVMKAPLPKPPVGWSFSGGNTDNLVEGTDNQFSISEQQHEIPVHHDAENSGNNFEILISKQNEESDTSGASESEEIATQEPGDVHKPLVEPNPKDAIMPTPLPQKEESNNPEIDQSEQESMIEI